MSDKADKQKQPENVWINLTLCILLPTLILMKGADFTSLEPAPILIIALLFPIGYGIYDFVARAKVNLFSVLGFVSVLLTGGIGLFKFPTEYFAIKEAAVPTLFGLAVIITSFTSKPLVSVFLLNKELFDVDKIYKELAVRQTEAAFKKLMLRCTRLLALSFFLSAALNYMLATIIVVSPAGTEAFNDEVGKMTGLGFVVIALPTMAITMYALWELLKGIKKLTGYEFEQVLQPHLVEQIEAKEAAKKN